MVDVKMMITKTTIVNEVIYQLVDITNGEKLVGSFSSLDLLFKSLKDFEELKYWEYFFFGQEGKKGKRLLSLSEAEEFLNG